MIRASASFAATCGAVCRDMYFAEEEIAPHEWDAPGGVQGSGELINSAHTGHSVVAGAVVADRADDQPEHTRLSSRHPTVPIGIHRSDTSSAAYTHAHTPGTPNTLALYGSRLTEADHLHSEKLRKALLICCTSVVVPQQLLTSKLGVTTQLYGRKWGMRW